MPGNLKKPTSQPRSINLGLQDMVIKKKFPSFKLFKNDPKNTYWIGQLQPTKSSNIYKVKIKFGKYPKVFILSPKILDFAPHRYQDKSLCLYHPNDKSYNPQMLISDTIIPWTSEWIFFYEIWLEEGIWWGEEAPHSPNGKGR